MVKKRLLNLIEKSKEQFSKIGKKGQKKEEALVTDELNANGKKKMKLRTKLVLSFVLSSVIPCIIIASLVFTVSRNAIEKQVTDITNEVSVHLTSNVNTILEEVDEIILTPYSNRELLDGLTIDQRKISDLEFIAKKQMASDFFQNAVNTTPIVNGFFFVNYDGEVFGNNNSTIRTDDFIESNLVENLKVNNGSSLWVGGFQGSFDDIFVLRNVRNNNGQDIGLLVLYMDIEVFNRVFETSDEASGRAIYVIDTNNKIVASNLSDEIGSPYNIETVNQNEELLSVEESANGWQVVISTPKSYLMKEMNQVSYIVYVILAIFIFLSVVIGVFLTFSITKPINKLVTLMKHAEQGNLTVRADYTNSNEIGQLGTSFNQMLSNIKTLIEENVKVSKEALANAEKVKEISLETSTASDLIASSIEEVADRGVEQVNYSEKTNKEMHELSNEIKEVTQNVATVARVTNETNKLSGQSIRDINQLVQKNEEVGRNNQHIFQAITKLNNEVKAIQSMVGVIKDISEQTNLLSLNASIEAARAGEAGKGFSVVSQEVRKLADQSKQATLEIESIIGSILVQTKNSVSLVKMSTELFDDQTKAVDVTRSSFENILSTTDTISKEMTSVEASIERMENAKTQVEQVISKVVHLAELSAASTEEITATTQEQAAAADELGNLAERLVGTIIVLEKTINKFKI
nr:methyl-accepting chemotaxis protein [Bacillus alkalicellulosilyticus]